MQSSSSSSHFSTTKQQLTRILKHPLLVSEHSSGSQGLGKMIVSLQKNALKLAILGLFPASLGHGCFSMNPSCFT
jgi:hypothetical protein